MSLYEKLWDHCKKGDIINIMSLIKYIENHNRYLLIHASSEYMFRLACDNNHLHIVKYLVSLYKTGNCDKIDIHICREYSFRHACLNVNINMVKFLINLYRKDKNYKPINIYEESLFGDCFKMKDVNIESEKKLIKYLYNLGNYNKLKKQLLII